MSAGDFGQFESPLDAYLDGLMTAEQRAAFERTLAGDEQLRAEVELQRQLDGSLARQFSPPSAERALSSIPETNASASPRILRLTPVSMLAAAAVVMLAGVGLWRWAYHDLVPSVHYWASEPYPLASIYRFEAADGFEPDWVCENDQQFAGSIWARLGQPLVLATVPPSVKPVGLGYVNSMSENTMDLLATVDGEQVLVFIDRASNAPETAISGLDSFRTGLRAFRRQIGDLVLIEVTPRDEPAVLDLFEIPKQDEEWLREGARSLGIEVD